MSQLQGSIGSLIALRLNVLASNAFYTLPRNFGLVLASALHRSMPRGPAPKDAQVQRPESVELGYGDTALRIAVPMSCWDAHRTSRLHQAAAMAASSQLLLLSHGSLDIPTPPLPPTVYGPGAPASHGDPLKTADNGRAGGSAGVHSQATAWTCLHPNTDGNRILQKGPNYKALDLPFKRVSLRKFHSKRTSRR